MSLFSGPSRMIVEEASLDDAPLLAEIHASAFARIWSEAEFAALLAGPGVFAIAVRSRSVFGARRTVGFVLFRVAAGEAEILTIAVRPGSRRRGHGRLLMEEALRRLYRDRISACFLEVDRANRAAVALYRSLGFVVAGERKRYYSEPQSGDGAALVMRVQLR
ncbi:MAG: GNAT family N-acetyltransferase [Bauldia sp.]